MRSATAPPAEAESPSVSTSPLVAGAALFMVGGAVHLLIGVLTPILFDPTAGRLLFLSLQTDTALYGAAPRTLLAADPALVQLRSTVFTALAGLLAGLGILELTVAWFGVRAGRRWAVVALIVSGTAMLPFWVVVLRPYLAAGIPVGLGDIPPFIWVPTALLLPATVLSVVGVARVRP